MEVEFVKKLILVIIGIPILTVFVGFIYASWRLGKIKEEEHDQSRFDDS